MFMENSRATGGKNAKIETVACNLLTELVLEE